IPARGALVPYTTLFRSAEVVPQAEGMPHLVHHELLQGLADKLAGNGSARSDRAARGERRPQQSPLVRHAGPVGAEALEAPPARRSEEHTSELQSPDHLV